MSMMLRLLFMPPDFNYDTIFLTYGTAKFGVNRAITCKIVKHPLERDFYRTARIGTDFTIFNRF